MKNTPISKLPWSYFQNEIRNCDGHGVAECSSEERAKQIVCAVNSHDELLEAAKKANDWLNIAYYDYNCKADEMFETMELLEKAIAKAEGKE